MIPSQAYCNVWVWILIKQICLFQKRHLLSLGQLLSKELPMRRINQCLNYQLGEIYQKALEIEKLQAHVLPLLPEELQAYFKVGSFQKSCLTLTTTDAVWASQLRYSLPELRDKIRRSGIHQLSSVKIQITEGENNRSLKKRAAISPLSKQSRSLIADTSSKVSYAPLQEALKRLSEN